MVRGQRSRSTCGSYWGTISQGILRLTALLAFCRCYTTAGNDLQNYIKAGSVGCVTWNSGTQTFELYCAVTWTGNNFITLHANEIFDGKDYNFELGGVTDFEGLFKIARDVSSYAEAPTIRNLHIRGGKTSLGAGFLVQANQQFFIVDSCSSSGTITGEAGVFYFFGSGGICGHSCAEKGQIKISNSFSTGDVSSRGGGGIAGAWAGQNGGIVNISNCGSSGKLQGQPGASTFVNVGGICGAFCGAYGGQIFIVDSFSKGEIAGVESGGIVGGETGFSGGLVVIEQCHSTGDITAASGGGITGDDPAHGDAEVRIFQCYSTGKIEGNNAGGICGQFEYNEFKACPEAEPSTSVNPTLPEK
eukprot:gb/GECG01015845.1/.p1 GENE.gb/GECG01015845.1/~~gb/GECG01015845.1/.p1  ORF type:complete len:360 (+),score=39.92 gb/GECG01015845.1/:1-1080(+)